MLRLNQKQSEQPSSSLPGLPVPEGSPYDGETEMESDVPVETPGKVVDNSSTSSPKKGTISIMSHTLKRKPTQGNISAGFVVLFWTVYMS